MMAQLRRYTPTALRIARNPSRNADPTCAPAPRLGRLIGRRFFSSFVPPAGQAFSCD